LPGTAALALRTQFVLIASMMETIAHIVALPDNAPPLETTLAEELDPFTTLLLDAHAMPISTARAAMPMDATGVFLANVHRWELAMDLSSLTATRSVSPRRLPARDVLELKDASGAHPRRSA